MATLNIKDPEVYRLAQALARRQQTTMTGAVRDALTEALERHRADRSGVAEALLELSRKYVPEDGYPLADEQMYDEQGLPIW